MCSRKASYSIEIMMKVYSEFKIFKCVVVAYFRYEKLEMDRHFLLMCTNMACNLCFSLLLCGIDCLSYLPRKIFSRNCKKLNCFCTFCFTEKRPHQKFKNFSTDKHLVFPFYLKAKFICNQIAITRTNNGHKMYANLTYRPTLCVPVNKHLTKI